MSEIEPFEAAIRAADKNPAEQLEAWRNYIKHELKKVTFFHEKQKSEEKNKKTVFSIQNETFDFVNASVIL